jgi:hypothetical protein
MAGYFLLEPVRFNDAITFVGPVFRTTYDGGVFVKVRLRVCGKMLNFVILSPRRLRVKDLNHRVLSIQLVETPRLVTGNCFLPLSGHGFSRAVSTADAVRL